MYFRISDAFSAFATFASPARSSWMSVSPFPMGGTLSSAVILPLRSETDSRMVGTIAPRKASQQNFQEKKHPNCPFFCGDVPRYSLNGGWRNPELRAVCSLALGFSPRPRSTDVTRTSVDEGNEVNRTAAVFAAAALLAGGLMVPMATS